MKNHSTSNALVLQMALFMAIRVFNKILRRKEIFEERQQFGLDYFASPINFLLKIGASKTIYYVATNITVYKNISMATLGK